MHTIYATSFHDEPGEGQPNLGGFRSDGDELLYDTF